MQNILIKLKIVSYKEEMNYAVNELKIFEKYFPSNFDEIKIFLIWL